MGWINSLADNIGAAIFEWIFGTLPAMLNFLSSAIWSHFVVRNFRPTQACPDILGMDGQYHTPVLEEAVMLNEFVLEGLVTPIMLLGILILGILFLFGHLFDLREKLKDAMPKFILAVILAYTTQFWMDIILSLGRALMATVYNLIPRHIGFGMFVRGLQEAESGWSILGEYVMWFVFSIFILTIVLAIMVALGVRLAVIYSGIAIMPLPALFLGIPYVDKVGKKFIKIWIQMVFFIFWMAIPAILLGVSHGVAAFGFAILILGMPFLMTTGEVLAMRGAGMISGGGMAQKAIAIGKLGGLKKAGMAAGKVGLTAVTGGAAAPAVGAASAGGAAGGASGGAAGASSIQGGAQTQGTMAKMGNAPQEGQYAAKSIGMPQNKKPEQHDPYTNEGFAGDVPTPLPKTLKQREQEKLNARSVTGGHGVTDNKGTGSSASDTMFNKSRGKSDSTYGLPKKSEGDDD